MTVVQNFSEGFAGSYERTKNIEHTEEELAYVNNVTMWQPKEITLRNIIHNTYSCNLCPYQATQKQDLKSHLKL